MFQPSKRKHDKIDLSSPDATVYCFFNSIFGHTRNWPMAFLCLAPEGRRKFESERGLTSFADYWEDRLSCLEDFVRKRHEEYRYTHRTCFFIHSIHEIESSDEHAVIAVKIFENHLASERLTVAQTKELQKHGSNWLLRNGELEGKLDDIIAVESMRHRPSSRNRVIRDRSV